MRTNDVEGTVTSRSRNPLDGTGIATAPQHHKRARDVALAATAIAAPLAVGLATAALGRSRRAGWIAGGATGLLLGLVRWQLQRWFTHEPAYEVERRIGGLEIRRYASRVEARTRIEGRDFDGALDEGFHRLAGYIFGGNLRGESIAMTAPVTAQRGEHLAMTAPVVSRRGGSSDAQEMVFVMPPGRSLASLPRPNDPRIELVEVPAQRIAVLRFRGRYNGDTVPLHAVRLRDCAAAAGLVGKGEPMFAGFDPPSTLPLLRRNEMWLELA